MGDDTWPRINLLISDVGDNRDFGPRYVNSQSDLETLRKCDGVMVVNWASNLKGTQLAKYAFRKSPNAIHFVDPADIDNRRDEFKNDLLKLASFIDVLSLNENECRSLGNASGYSSLLPPNSYNGNDLKNAAKKLASKSECLLKSIQARELHGLMDLRRLLLAPSRSKLRRLRVQEIPGIPQIFWRIC